MARNRNDSSGSGGGRAHFTPIDTYRKQIGKFATSTVNFSLDSIHAQTGVYCVPTVYVAMIQ